MKNLFLLFVTVFASILLSSCESDLSNLQAAEIYESNMSYGMSELPSFSSDSMGLTEIEINGLIQMREEEKMAMDVYDLFYKKFNLIVFDRISDSESRHSAAVLSLLDFFNLTDPALSASGNFSNPDIQSLYNRLVSVSGSEDALKVGAYIEEYDISDLKILIEETENIDIKTVYTHLLLGSENHLRAFARNLKVRGIIYQPQILNSDDFETILSGKSITPVLDTNGRCI